MKNKGFTLAEVLISLAIIGLIASMTLPALQTNIAKQKAAPAFMKAMNDLQYAVTMLMQEQNVRSLEHSLFNNIRCTAGVRLLVCLQNENIMVLNPTALGSTSFYRRPDSSTSTYTTLNTAFVGKNGVAYVPVENDSVQYANNTINTYRYLIDINGPSNGPNMLSKDAFIIEVSSRGRVLAYGSNEWVDVTQSNSANAGWNGSNNRDKCSNGQYPGGTSISCAGAIVDNGGKIMYKY